MIVSIDIETSCNQSGCPGYGGHKQCNHALDAHHSKIDVVGAICEDGTERVFRNLSQFDRWLQTIAEGSLLEFGGHNFRFDLKHLKSHGVDVLQYGKWTWDTQLMAHTYTEKIPAMWLESYSQGLVAGQRKAGPLSLKTLAPYFLQVAPYWEVDDKDNDDYVLTDARYTLELRTYLEKQLKETNQLAFYSEKVQPWALMLYEAESRGIVFDLLAADNLIKIHTEQVWVLKLKLDKEWELAHQRYLEIRTQALIKKYRTMEYNYREGRANHNPEAVAKRYSELCSIAIKKLSPKINYNSPTQLKWLFGEYLSLPIADLDGDESTGVATIESLIHQGYSGLQTFLEWRKETKLLQFIEQFKETQVDGVLYTHYNLTGTRTGRLSSSDINIQQINKKLKPLFKPRDGFVFVGYDLRSIETALIAGYTENKKLFDIFNSGNSPHNYNVKVFFDLPEAEDEIPSKYPVQRSATKNVGFALFYGAGVNRIKQTFATKGFMFTDNECAQLLANYREAYADVFTFHQEITKVFASGETITNLLGRPLKIQDPQDAYMKGFNMLIQSSASDLCLQGALRAFQASRKLGLQAFPLFFVHDYVGFEVAREQAAQFAEILKHALTDFKIVTQHGPIQLGVEGGISDEWE